VLLDSNVSPAREMTLSQYRREVRSNPKACEGLSSELSPQASNASDPTPSITSKARGRRPFVEAW
jgi:hypothetical protein